MEILISRISQKASKSTDLETLKINHYCYKKRLIVSSLHLRRFVQMEHGCKEINKNLSKCPLDFAEAFRLVITTMKVKMKTMITLVEKTKMTALKALAYQGRERLTRIYFPTPNNSVTLIIIRTFYVSVILQPGFNSHCETWLKKKLI